MKFTSIFATALAAMVAFSSCSKDDNGVEALKEGAETTMSLSFTLPASMTRADVAGVGIESVVENITVYIYDANGEAVTGNGTQLSANPSTGDFDISGTTYTLKADKEIATTAGDRRVYIAANVSPLALTEAALLAAKIQMSQAATATSLAMFSELKEPTFIAKAEAQSNADNAAINKVATNLDRIVSKVVVTKTSATFDQTFDHITETGAKVVYTVDQWGVGKGASSVFAVKGNVTTNEYNAFDASVFTKVVIPVAGAKSEESHVAYVGENTPKNGLQGEATYVMVRTKAAPTHVAQVNGSGDIEWVSAGTLTDMWVAISYNQEAYFCATKAIAEAVAAKAGGGNVYEYPGCYVYFRTFINQTDGVIARNEFIHLNVTGVANNKFAGIPGDKNEGGGEPIDPENPDQPDPIDPTEPIVEEEAYMMIEVTVNPWLYAETSWTLE